MALSLDRPNENPVEAGAAAAAGAAAEPKVNAISDGVFAVVTAGDARALFTITSSWPRAFGPTGGGDPMVHACEC